MTNRSFGRLSVVIPNYNYGRFVAAAIGSALAVEWPDVEVIVVDDGSTDNSREVIDGFGDRVHALFQTNRGPREACNAGYAVSTGDIVIFLDSDDMLCPSIAQEVNEVWRPGVSKVQVQMVKIDEHGRAGGAVFPRLKRTPSPADVRRWLITMSAYPTPPGSGNAYSREFLEQLLPIDDRCGDAMDSACLAAAPLLGDVVTLRRVLVGYRQHGANRSALRDGAVFRRQIDRAYQRQAFVLELLGLTHSQGAAISALFRSRHLLQMRVAERRLNHPAPPPLPTDSRRRMVHDAVRGFAATGPEPVTVRIATSIWALGVLVLPSYVARRLIHRRFS
ncbi:glycosyltransferase family A protein [Lapillicoccus sp.]|uniref:glycosyltransferase family 2 protein n=1 Tax=Lapillicoccus sp. TaxID=1909287 RepID=UPI0025CC9982|nr:glycosyltransferase family A protein [Lapillicoccus sp.]